MATTTTSSSTTTTTVSVSPEDESLKRNTDCVYFLASPLTCKKGSECEYRHSEYARVNPRDCWYWLNGNCLNPKCSFRHPPLDGLMTPQAGGSFSGPSVPAPPVAAAPVGPHTAATVKQAVPCVFFQKGYCLKGEVCPYLHGPGSSGAKIQPISASVPATKPPSVVKPAFGGLEKCSQPIKNIQTISYKKVVVNPAQVKAIPKVVASQPRDGVLSIRRVPPTNALIEEAPKYKETAVPLIDNGRSRSRISHVHRPSSLDDQTFQNGRDVDDSLRESSPGFDVLVDDKLRDEEYYQHEDQFARMRGHDGRSLNEFEMNRYDDYNNSAADVDSELYQNRRGYDSYDHLQERYARDQRRGSSERSPGESAQYDRRGSYKSESPDIVQNSDLRQRLSKQRRGNGLKSIVNPDHNRDNHAEGRGYRATVKDARRSPTHESSRSSRLQGRIKIPRSSPPVGGAAGSIYPERGYVSERNSGRSSPSRPQAVSQQGRLRGRLSGRINENTTEEKERVSRGPLTRRDSIIENVTTFAGPKSLAELKGNKQTDTKQTDTMGQQTVSMGKLRDTVLATSVENEGDLTFDGPKPLSEILKRKRDTTGTNSVNKENNQNGNNEDNPISSHADSSTDIKNQTGLLSEPENKHVIAEVRDEEGEISNKKLKLTEGEGSIPDEIVQPEIEGGFNVAEGEELELDQEHTHKHDEEYDQGDGEYDYEQYEGEGYDLNEGETVDNEDEFMDEDDGDDDFAKKIGVSI